MALNLIKLCVGVDTIEELADWIELKQAERRARGEPAEQVHTTRMFPKRRDELLDGGSLYWVIKGFVQVRQRLVDLREHTDEAGIPRCRIVMEPVLHATEMQPRRPFQGWRYLAAKDAPKDLPKGGEAEGLDPEMARALSELGLL